MTTHTHETEAIPSLRTLPGDDVRQVMWGFADRFDLRMLVQSVRAVARGPVARLVAEGARNTHEWTEAKAGLLKAFDEAGITSAYLGTEYGGCVEGPKNLALALIAFELAWVDAGAGTSSMAGMLALAPIHERGTPEQRDTYLSRAAPQPGAEPWRGAFCLTEPLPYVGVETNLLSGKARVVEWEEGQEPILQVDKRGRFITNAGFADFVTAAIAGDDERIKGTCMVILERTDPGTWDPGAPTRKLVHQLSSTRDPIFSLRVPASRIIGGYTVRDGVIVPNFSHGEVIEAIFRRTRVTVGLMTAAKLLSAVEPVIRYQRERFRGDESGSEGSPRYEHGLQQKEDALHRLIDVWATGEAASSLGFAAARLFDQFDPIEREKEWALAEQGVKGARAQMRVFRDRQAEALEYIGLIHKPDRDEARPAELEADPVLRFMVLDAEAQVLCPAVKLWNTGHGANMLREAVSLMGGYGITEDCPGFLGHKWMDAQLEATYEGPEAVQRRQLTVTMVNDLFLAQFRHWVKEMRRVASRRPGTGACTLASAMELWLYTLKLLQESKDADDNPLFHGHRHGVVFPMADALCWLLASRCQILDVLALEESGAPEREGFVRFFTDLCHVQAARTAGEVSRICAELAFGYRRHPSWDGAEGCYREEDLIAIEELIPGIAGGASADAVDAGGGHADKAGPCVQFEGMETFRRLRGKLDGCLTSSRLAKDRAARALTEVMIPQAPDYPR